MRRTILLEIVEKTKKDTKGDDQRDKEGSEERAENIDVEDADEEEEKHSDLSEAKTLPTTEVSSSATGAEEDLEVVTITGLTEEGTDDDLNVDEIQSLESNADPMGEARETDLVSIIDIGPTEIAELTRPLAQRQIHFLTDEEPEEVLAREANRAVTARMVQRQKIKTREKSSSERGGRGRNTSKNDREEEMEVIREMSRREQAEKRKKERRERETSRRPIIEPVIASPRQKRCRGDDGVWKKALTISDNVELEQTAETGAPRAAYKQKREKPGNPSKSHPPHTVGTPRSNS